MEALQPPSAAGPAPGAQMAPERRAGAQARFEPQRRTCRWDPLRGQSDGVKIAAKPDRHQIFEATRRAKSLWIYRRRGIIAAVCL